MKEKLIQERDKLREMTFAEKRWYIWEYYKLHIIGFIIAAVFIGAIINSRINPPPREYLYIAWIGPPVQSHLLFEMADGLIIIVGDPDDTRIVRANSYTATGNPQMDSGLQQRFFAMMISNSIDIILTTRDGVGDVAAQGFSRPVHEVMEILAGLNPELYASIMDSETAFVSALYMPESEDEPAEDIMGISLAGSTFIESFGIDTEDLYLMVVVTTVRLEAIAKALEVFLS